MHIHEFIDHLPLWGLFLATVAVALLSLEAGFRLGRYRSTFAEPEKESAAGTIVGATLGLLAFLLAFTFGMASSRYDERRQVFLSEVTAIGTAYLRADLLPEPYRGETRGLLREYVDLRREELPPENTAQALRRSEALQGRLWSRAAAAGKASPGSIVAGLYIQSLNEVIDLHTKRMVLRLRSRVPGVIWIVLYAITILSMTAAGYHAGLSSAGRPLAIPVLALVFAAVMYLIADLDRPREGMIRVDQQAMVELRNSMEAPGP